jgi:transcriptional regulator with XRE-family HTH domain
MSVDFRKVRRLSGCTQIQLSKRTGISRVRLSLAETGQLILKREEKVRILRFLIEQMEQSSRAIQKARQELSEQDSLAMAGESLSGQ